MRLIDADKIKYLDIPIAPVLVGEEVHYEKGFLKEWIDEIPTVEAVPMNIIENIKAGIKCYIVDDDISGNTPNMLRISHAERNMAYKIVLNLIDRYIGHISGEEQK